MKKGILLIATIAMAATAMAQRFPRAPRTPSLGVSVQVGNPEGHYEEVYAGTPAGIGVQLSIPLNRWSPLEIGADLGFNSMGSHEVDIPVVDEWGYTVNGDLNVNHNYQAYHGMLRFRPFNGRVKPYVDGYAGFKSHNTVLKVDYHNGYENVTVQRDVLERDWTESFGWGVGLQVELTRHINLDIRTQRLNGGGTSLVDKNSVQIFQDGGVGYDQLSTPSTPINVTNVGLTLTF